MIALLPVGLALVGLTVVGAGLARRRRVRRGARTLVWDVASGRWTEAGGRRGLS